MLILLPVSNTSWNSGRGSVHERQISLKDDHGKGLDVIIKIILRKIPDYLSLEERVS